MYKVDYIWISGPDSIREIPFTIKCKTKILDLDVKDIPQWNFDGSSTEQATLEKSEIMIVPRRIYNNPFGKEYDKLVICDTFIKDNHIIKPHPTNTRHKAEEIFKKYGESKPWYGIEQEFFLIDNKTKKPLGFSNDTNSQDQYYCSVGSLNSNGRIIIDEIVEKANYAGINVTGYNSKKYPGQWEIQILNEGINAGDDIWVLRYIMERITEKYNFHISFNPKPLKNDWEESSAHVNFSTLKMREEGGLNLIIEAIEKLQKKHTEHIKEIYNRENYRQFTYGIGDRTTSVRISNDTYHLNCGYFEDRRPLSSMDPYIVTSKILETISLENN